MSKVDEALRGTKYDFRAKGEDGKYVNTSTGNMRRDMRVNAALAQHAEKLAEALSAAVWDEKQYSPFDQNREWLKGSEETLAAYRACRAEIEEGK